MSDQPVASQNGALTDLARHVQALEGRSAAQSRSAAATPPMFSSGSGIVFLSEIVPVDSDTGSTGVAWTTFDLSTRVPRGATKVYLRIWLMLDGANCDGSIEIRPYSGGPEYTAAKLTANGGSATDDTNSDTVIALFPCDPGRQSFDYQVTVTTDVDFVIELWGYEA